MFLFLALFLRIEPRLLELMIRNRGFHPVRNELHALLDFRNLVRKHRLPQFHARARFVQQIDRLVRQEPVGNVAAREIHGVADRIFRIAHGMEFFIAVAHALQHANRLIFSGCGHLDRLEAPLERAILLNRLAVFGRRCRADALNLAPAQRRLQNVGGVERPFRRSRSHQRVQFVDEDDRVLALHQFLHDSLQPFFELPAILRPGHDQRQIERENPLVREERRHVAIRDALRQPFDDRRLAHPRLADQDRIVLRAPAQNLNGALEFAVAPDQRIELSFHGRLRQIAAEFCQQGCFFGTVHGHLSFSRAASKFLAHGR